MAKPWVGSRKVGFILARVNDPNYDQAPIDWADQVNRRLFFDPDPISHADGSLRQYFHTISYGRAKFEADILGIVDVAPCDFGAAVEAMPTAHLYDYMGIIFPSNRGGCTGWAFYNTLYPFNPPRVGNKLIGWFRIHMGESLGIWAMECLHAVTSFGDLYQAPNHPGPYDEMACSCGTHPSTFTKLALGWLDSANVTVVAPGNPASLTLHAMAYLQPPPPGRTTAIRIPNRTSPKYYLVEARLPDDQYDRFTENLATHVVISNGIPGGGVVVCLVDESVWAPLTLKAVLALGQTFSDQGEGVEVTVTGSVLGGFTVTLSSTENTACPDIRDQIAGEEIEVADLQAQLSTAATGEKAAIVVQIRRHQAQIKKLQAQATELGCLPA